jgi:probable rRNA maturation factor
MITFSGDTKHLTGLKNKIKRTVHLIASQHHFSINSLDYIFQGDEEILKINIEALGHDYYTDIITFDYSENKSIEGEIYVSVDRVKDNALTYKTALQEELLRVIFHGVLHIVGYKDKTKTEKDKMRDMENKYIKLFHVEQL